MPQPGMSGMEPVFGEAYGSHRSLFTSYPLSASPLGGRTECDQSVVLMLGSAAVPQKRPFELLSDLVDDGFGEDLHHELWDISALDDFTYYTKGSAEGEPASSEGVLIGRWGDRKDGGRQEERQQRDQLGLSGKQQQEGSEPATEERLITQKGKVTEASCVEVFERPECQDVVSPSSPAPALELCSEEHNYSLQADRASSSSQGSDSETADTEEEEEEEEEEKDEEEVEIGDDKTRHAEHGSNDKRVGERPAKRRCFWEYNHAHDTGSKGLGVRWPFSWNSSTLPSTLYRREGTSGKKGRRKARKTDASDLTPNPQKLCSIGEQLQKLNVAIDGMGHVNDLPVVARARSRKEKNKLASRACRLKKKAQHEANKIKLWGLNQEYENLLGSLLRIKEVIRQRVERSEEDGSVGMTKQLEDILKESSGPLVAGRTREFVERILQCSAGRQEERKTQGESKTSS